MIHQKKLMSEQKLDTIIDNWHSLLWTADEFFILYFLSCKYSLNQCTMFLIGHAVELYLKSVYIKQRGRVKKKDLIRLGHDIKLILAKCQKIDPGFMPYLSTEKLERAIEIEKENKILKEASKNKEFRHFYFNNQEFITIAAHLPDLKYLGLRKKEGKLSFGFICPNDYWIRFIKQVRSYLNYPGERNFDPIKKFIDENPEDSTYFLGLYTKSKK